MIFPILLLYVVFRLPFLTRLPIFNDEAIYLEWGWHELHTPGALYFSLFDGKQPLLMWIFGFIQRFPFDPLLLGRFISVILGACTALGIYKIAQKYFSENTATVAVLLYILIPLFSFFDRQALMESAVAAIGVWSLYFTLQTMSEKKYVNPLILGVLWGIGFFIKSSSIFFVFSSLFLFAVLFFQKQKSTKKQHILFSVFLSLLISQLILFPLYLQPDFSIIFSRNDRFSLSVLELLHFPLLIWGKHFLETLDILFWHFTPLVTLFSLLGFITVKKQKDQNKSFILSWVLLGLTLFVFTVRTPSPRYLVSFLPLLCIFCAEGLLFFQRKLKVTGLIVMIFTLFLPFAIILLQLISPIHYFSVLEKVSSFSHKEFYIEGWTSGYGVQEAVAYLNAQAKDQQIRVWTRGDWGNPETSMFIYLRRNPNISLSFFNHENMQRLFQPRAKNWKDVPTYFVSRDENLVGLEHFSKLERKFFKPGEKNFIGIYRLQTFCF